MRFYSRKLIKPGDLNARNTLFGGMLLKWIDEEAGIYAMTKLNSKNVVTKFISEIDFVSSGKQGDVVEIRLDYKSIEGPPLLSHVKSETFSPNKQSSLWIKLFLLMLTKTNVLSLTAKSNKTL